MRSEIQWLAKVDIPQLQSFVTSFETAHYGRPEFGHQIKFLFGVAELNYFHRFNEELA